MPYGDVFDFLDTFMVEMRISKKLSQQCTADYGSIVLFPF